MNHRERFLAAVRMEPVDRIPFWPKIFNGYLKNQESTFKGCSLEEAYKFFDSEIQYGLPEFIVRSGKRSSQKTRRENDLTIVEYILDNHSRRLVMKDDPTTLTSHPIEFPINNESDLDFMAEWFSDGEFYADISLLEKQRDLCVETGEDAAFAYFVGESPLMNFLEHLANIGNGHYLLHDFPEKTERLFAEMHRNLLMRCRVASSNPFADMFYFSENTSTTLISPDQFVRYCKPQIKEYADILNRSGVPVLLHMCGHLKGLLNILAENPVAGFEAFTPPTVGNTSLLDGRTACPDMSLIGGTNAVMWLWETGDIIKYIYEMLDSLPHTNGIVLSPAGVMPPAAEPEKIKSVCEAISKYPVRNR